MPQGQIATLRTPSRRLRTTGSISRLLTHHFTLDQLPPLVRARSLVPAGPCIQPAECARLCRKSL